MTKLPNKEFVQKLNFFEHYNMVLDLCGEIRQQFGSVQYTLHNGFFTKASLVQSWSEFQNKSTSPKEKVYHFEAFSLMKLAALMPSSTQTFPTPLNENYLNFQLFNRVKKKTTYMYLFYICIWALKFRNCILIFWKHLLKDFFKTNYTAASVLYINLVLFYFLIWCWMLSHKNNYFPKHLKCIWSVQGLGEESRNN